MSLFDKERTFSQYYHKYRCFRLLEAYQQKYNIKFNCIIIFRADVDSSDEFIVKPLEENTIYIPEGKDYYGLNDQIAYGNYESEINNAIQQNKNACVNVNKIFDFYKNNINIFCDEIYNNVFNNKKLYNTIENYYN
jgi:hypothetical protein